jgi:uncharacterized protein (DUF1697 family)
MLQRMYRYIILLRGVTPTGKNKVLMAPLRAALEYAGLTDVQTYIQSGNVIATSDLSQADLETLVHEVIKRQFGGDIAVLVRTVSYFRTILGRNPFPQADTAKLYFTLLASIPEAHAVNEFLALGYAPDQVQVIDDMVYVLCATKYSDVKANNNFIERKLKVVATTRVYKTIANLVVLSKEEL